MTTRINTSSLSRSIALLCSMALCLPMPARADEVKGPTRWGRFLGENGVGRLASCDVPLPWNPNEVAWEIALPGKGNGSPVIWGELAYVSSADVNTGEQHLHAVHTASGQVKWHKSFASRTYAIHARSSFASSTPCVNDAGVFFSWANPDSVSLVALSHEGNELWRKDLGTYVSQHGFGASPILVGQTLVLFNSQDAEELPPGVAPGQSRVTAFDSLTGETLWETPRTTTRVCYGTPTVFNDSEAGAALLLSNTGDGLSALSLDTGKVLWSRKVFSKRCVSCPRVIGDFAIGTEGSGGGGNVLVAVDLHGEHEVKFRIDRSAPYVPSPVALGDLLFLWGDTGIVSCVRLPSAEVLWSKRIGGNVSSSPVIAGDKLIGIAEDGTVTLLAAAAEFRELGSIKLEETCRSTPALSEHFMLLRTDQRLICIGTPTTETN